MKINRHLTLDFSLLILLILFGTYLALTSGYGSDEDTLPMIGVFQGILKNGIVMSSRFTGYPVPELGIGFLAHNFGSWATNLATFSFFIAGIIFFYLALNRNIIFQNCVTFLLLCITSPILFFDNIEPIDYSWAFLFFSMGLFCLKKKFFEFSVLFFGFCIGTRINFTPFILASIYLFDYGQHITLKRKTGLFLCSFIIGGLFYLTIWYQNHFGLEWLTSARPVNQGLFGLLSRFIYKTILAIGPIFFIFVIGLFLKKRNYLKKFENFNLVAFIILLNLLIFIYIPAEMSYLQPMLICLFFLLNKVFSKKVIYILIFINLFSWFIDISFLKINYRTSNTCDNVEAVSADLNIEFKKGKLSQFYSTRNRIVECWIKDEDRGKIIANGGALKNNK